MVSFFDSRSFLYLTINSVKSLLSFIRLYALLASFWLLWTFFRLRLSYFIYIFSNCCFIVLFSSYKMCIFFLNDLSLTLESFSKTKFSSILTSEYNGFSFLSVFLITRYESQLLFIILLWSGKLRDYWFSEGFWVLT